MVAPALEVSVIQHAKVRLLERYRALKVPFFGDIARAMGTGRLIIHY